MTPRERFEATLRHEPVDHPPLHVLLEHEGIQRRMTEFLGCADYEAALQRLGADIRWVDHKLFRPKPKPEPDGSNTDMWGVRRKSVRNQFGTYDEVFQRPLADIQTMDDLRRYPWPSPDVYDFTGLADMCRKHHAEHPVVFGGPGIMDLLNGTSFGRGMDIVLMDVATEDPVGLGILEVRFEFFLEVTRRALEAAGAWMDVLWIGDDYGMQTGPLFRPELWRRVLGPKLQAFIDLGHSYGARVMLHSCGSNRQLVPVWIDMGLDIYQAVQVEAEGMEPGGLFRDFGRHITFHGMMGMQSIMPHGSPEEVRSAVRERIRQSGGSGYIAAPSHFVDLDVPLENVAALYEEAGKARE